MDPEPSRLLESNVDNMDVSTETTDNLDRTDDNQPTLTNPTPKAVIPANSANNYSEIQRLSNNELLETYRVNKSKLHKIEHHLKFLKESLDSAKYQKGYK